MKANPRISLVMATYNRAETIRTTLDHLAKQTLRPEDYEVIVVDDGSPDDTGSVVESLRPAMPFTLTYLRHPNAGPGFTQNRGMREARAPIVCLIADDIFLAPGALEAHLRAHESHPEPHYAVLGKVLQAPHLDQSLFLRRWDPFKFRELEAHEELPWFLFWACNVSFKRDFMLAHGMFHDRKGRAGAAAHEDVELGYRLAKHGMRLLYRKEAFGHHYHLENLEGACRRALERGLNWGEFRRLADDPEITVRYHVVTRRTLRDYFTVFRRAGTPQLGADRNPLLLFARIGLRAAAFNGVTVPLFWLPLARAAERRATLAPLMNTQVYRGIIAHHFFKGVALGEARDREERDAGPHVPQC